MPYRVLVDDNFHYMDEDERYELGAFLSLEAAIAAAQAVVDKYLAAAHRPGMTAREVFENYTTFGEDPFILAPDDSGVSFSAWEYAKRRCEDLCGRNADSKDDRSSSW
jgi:hypothetical protein